MAYQSAVLAKRQAAKRVSARTQRRRQLHNFQYVTHGEAAAAGAGKQEQDAGHALTSKAKAKAIYHRA